MATAAARRYAQAAFELADAEGHVDEWREQLAILRTLVSDTRAAAILLNPTIPAQERMDLVAAEPALKPEAINLARLLIETRRVDEIGDVADEFDSLADEAARRIRVTVTTAVELSPQDRERVAEELGRRLTDEVRIHTVIDPRVVGGLKLQYGDHLIDATVATRLDQLRRLLAGAS